MADALWQAREDQKSQSQLYKFADYLKASGQFDWHNDVHELWRWSVAEKGHFWSAVWDFAEIIGDKGELAFCAAGDMRQDRYFPDAKLNFAENLLRHADARPALIAHNEAGQRQEMSRAQLKERVDSLAHWLKQAGLQPGDRVAAYMPNCPETVIIMLATTALGGIFSSCSSDFGHVGVIDRFQQITPRFLFCADGYRYAGKTIDRLPDLPLLRDALESVDYMVVVPYLDPSPDISGWATTALWAETQNPAPPVRYHRSHFNDPLCILYSSGTTGRPKCITHTVGGTLIQHMKEYLLHADIHKNDRVFYFTTCGWMMWNWLTTQLAVEATLVLYEGNPSYPSLSHLWEIAAAEKLTLFGTSAKYIDSLRKAEFIPKDQFDLSALRLIASTGSPLAPEGYDYVYTAIKPDVHLASISGGTDIMSCFALGSIALPVRAGRLQMRGLGMDVQIWNDDGQAVIDEPGELVCVSSFPSQPWGFWNDPDGTAYHNAYYDYFPGIWRHGDWATLYASGELVIHGRSDTTLNPGGVRIGTAEIYRIVESFPQILESVVVGRPNGADQDVVLFVRMASGAQLDDGLQQIIRAAIRKQASPRHVPALIAEVADIPRTRSGKISEIAIRNILSGRAVTNTQSLQNPEALEIFQSFRAE